MTQEEKAKEFDASLERAKKLIETCDSTAVIGWCEYIFPMLKEPMTEDEKARKSIVELVMQSSEILSSNNQSRMLAWLEKQGEQKPFDYENCNIQQHDFAPKTALEAIKEEKVDNANKVKTKFKVGDWIVDKSGLSQQVLDFRGGIYTCTYNSFTTDCESNYHHWTLEDAKDGDILVLETDEVEWVLIYKDIVRSSSEVPHDLLRYYSLLADNYCNWKGECAMVTEDYEEYLKPATIAQRKLLFTKMKEKGWSWNATTKELSQSKVTKISDKDGMATDIAIKALNHNIANDSYCKENCKGYQETGKCYADWDCEAKRKAEQNLTWSEEDEVMCQETIDWFEQKCFPYASEEENPARKSIQWLKSLKQRMQ